MRIITLLLIIATLFTSCKKDPSEKLLFEVLKENEVTAQNFTVPSNGTQLVVGDRGTRIYVNPENLISENGEIGDSITVSLTELTTKEELLKANAQTVSNGRWLISGGAYRIAMYSNGEALKIKEGKSIKVEFPRIAEEPMQLFYGERENNEYMNWKESDVSLQDKKYPVILHRDFSYLAFDEAYAIYRLIDSVNIDTLKRQSISEFRTSYKNADSLVVINDTLHAYTSVALRTIQIDRSIQLIDQLYEVVYLKKLDWINVDRFYPKNLERVTLEIEVEKDAFFSQLYLLDKTQNTVLNLFENTEGKIIVDIPINVSFDLIILAIKDEKIFGSRETISISSSQKYRPSLKKMTKEELNKLFDLNQ
ncbi:hypothetical protein ACFQ1M_14035 [Sungkyunkwania multivorans]|uniref:Plasminogen-binding protein PgbA N-terminal domain-containing protein n=1 Tax=Sungkyunkwania multivorans TaxID=1173618 RepID=A0ABW3D2G8_9FLAO